MDIMNENTGETGSKWVKIHYDYISKYCKESMLQGHNEEECWRLHPQLMEENDKSKQTGHDNVKEKGKDKDLSLVVARWFVNQLNNGKMSKTIM